MATSAANLYGSERPYHSYMCGSEDLTSTVLRTGSQQILYHCCLSASVGLHAQVKAVRDAAKPYTKSVGRSAKRLSMAASGALVAAGRRMSTPSRPTPRVA